MHTQLLTVIHTSTHTDNSAGYYPKISPLSINYVPYKTY